MNGEPPAPECPYVGLAPFEAAHAQYFFGRTLDSAVIADNVIGRRITVLYGASGVGKSSLLNVGLPKALVELGLEPWIVTLREWHEPTRRTAWLDGVGAPSARMQPFILVLDQFEEFFVYSDTEQVKAIGLSLAALLARADVDAHLLFGIRDDALHRLDALRLHLPGLLDTTLELRHLDPPAVRQAIVQPIHRWNERHVPAVALDETFAPVLIAQLSPKDVDGQAAKDGRIELAYLQLALEKVWEAEGGARATALRTATLTERLQGIGEIARRHVEDVLERLPEANRALCATVFDRLVTPSGGKILYSAADLAAVANEEPGRMDAVLAPLASGKGRLLRAVQLPGGKHARGYEILHDILARPILDWRARYIQDAEESRRQAAKLKEQEEAALRREARSARRLRRLAFVLVVVALIATTATYRVLRQQAIIVGDRATIVRERDALKQADRGRATVIEQLRATIDQQNAERAFTQSFSSRGTAAPAPVREPVVDKSRPVPMPPSANVESVTKTDSLTGSLAIRLRDIYGAPVVGNVRVELRHRTLNEMIRADLNGGSDIQITNLRKEPQGLYVMTVDPALYRPVQRFVTVGSQQVQTVLLPFDPVHTTAIFPNFGALPESLRNVLSNSDRVVGFEGRSGSALYDGLDDARKANLLNVFAKAAAQRVAQDRTAWSAVRMLLDVKSDRLLSLVASTSRLDFAASVDADLFRPVNASLHLPPQGFALAGAFKSVDAFGMLQVTLFAREDQLAAEFDVDDAAGLGHVFQIARNTLTGAVHPYDIYQILVSHQHLQPPYRLAAAGQ